MTEESVSVSFWYLGKCVQVLGAHVAGKGTVAGMDRE